MNKRIWVWTIILLLLIISMPGLINRWQVEAENNSYEIIAPYEEIYDLSLDGTMTVQEILSTLKEAGLNTVSINPFSLNDLEDMGVIQIYDEVELKEKLEFTVLKDEFHPKDKGYYITTPESDDYNEVMRNQLGLEEIKIDDTTLYFLPLTSNLKPYTNIGFDEQLIKQIQDAGLHGILRVENDKSKQADQINKEMVNTLIDLKDKVNPTLLFTGEDIIGFPDKQSIKSFSTQLLHANFQFYMIEFANQKGFEMFAKNGSDQIIRLHSMGLNNNTLEENIQQAIRAVKERNIRTIFFHIPDGEPTESLETAVDFIEGVYAEMPRFFNTGTPVPFKQLSVSNWMTLIVLIAGILFTYNILNFPNNKKITVLFVTVMVLLAIGYLALQKLLLLQIFALIIAILTPTYAVMATVNKKENTIRTIILQYGKAIGINITGILIIIGLLNDTSFITGFELFRGVKLVYIIPILLLIVRLFAKNIIELLHIPVKYWHLAIILLLGLVGFYYISRTGNAGTVSNMELTIRNTLESILYVRPRTKEFLIGFPFYLLALYVMSNYKLFGKILLVPGMIGFVSMVNTFTHFHIPLYISVLRTFYSILFGFIIGMVLIYLFKLVFPYISKAYQKRWI